MKTHTCIHCGYTQHNLPNSRRHVKLCEEKAHVYGGSVNMRHTHFKEAKERSIAIDGTLRHTYNEMNKLNEEEKAKIINVINGNNNTNNINSNNNTTININININKDYTDISDEMIEDIKLKLTEHFKIQYQDEWGSKKNIKKLENLRDNLACGMYHNIMNVPQEQQPVKLKNNNAYDGPVGYFEKGQWRFKTSKKFHKDLAKHLDDKIYYVIKEDSKSEFKLVPANVQMQYYLSDIQAMNINKNLPNELTKITVATTEEREKLKRQLEDDMERDYMRDLRR